MRVVLVSNLFPPAFVGGYELAAADVAGMLAARGHDVLVLSSPALDRRADPPRPYAVRRTLDYLWNDFDPIPAAVRRFKEIHLNVRSLDALRAAVLEHAPDVVCCFNLAGLGGFGTMRFLRAAGVPAVAVLMDNWFLGVGSEPAETAALRRWFDIEDGFSGAQVVACSRSLLGELEAVLGEAVAEPRGRAGLGGSGAARGGAAGGRGDGAVPVQLAVVRDQGDRSGAGGGWERCSRPGWAGSRWICSARGMVARTMRAVEAAGVGEGGAVSWDRAEGGDGAAICGV